MSEIKQEAIDQFEMTCFSIVAQVGSARSCYLEAITCAENGDFEAARKLIDEGNVVFSARHYEPIKLNKHDHDSNDVPML